MNNKIISSIFCWKSQLLTDIPNEKPISKGNIQKLEVSFEMKINIYLKTELNNKRRDPFIRRHTRRGSMLAAIWWVTLSELSSFNRSNSSDGGDLKNW